MGLLYAGHSGDREEKERLEEEELLELIEGKEPGSTSEAAQRPAPGKLSRTHGGSGNRAASSRPGKVPLTFRLANQASQPEARPVPVGRVQRRASSSRAPSKTAKSALAEAAQSSGQPLPPELRALLETLGGVSLADVRIHTGPESDKAAREISAQAYTVGQDIHFANGKYDPHSERGRELIAHEVAHALQQRNASASKPQDLSISTPGDATEKQADDFAKIFEMFSSRIEAHTQGAASPAERAEAGSAASQKSGPEATGVTAPVSAPATANAAAPASAGLSAKAAPALATPAPAAMPAISRAEIAREEDPEAPTPEGNTESEEEAELDIEAKLQALGFDQGAAPKLFSHVVKVVEADEGLQTQLEGDTADKNQLTAKGRQDWRQSVGDDKAYLQQLAQELGDSDATDKISQISGEGFFDTEVNAASLKQEFFRLVADELQNEAKTNYLTANKIYDANGSAFTEVVGQDGGNRFCRKGRVLDLPAHTNVVHRTSTLGAFFNYNTTQEFRNLWENNFKRLIKTESQDSTGGVSAFDYWAYKCATDVPTREQAHTGLDRTGNLGGGNGTTWWSYTGVELEEFPYPEMRAHAGWANMLQMAGLEPEWYDTGAVKLQIDANQLRTMMQGENGPKLRKPTALDGVLSPLYEPNVVPETGWGITSGGLPEAVAPFLPASLIVEGSEGVDPLPQGADQIFTRLQEFIVTQEHGSPEGLREFGDENRPQEVSIQFNPVMTIPLPSGEAGPTVEVSNPPINHPGVTIKQVSLQMGGEEGSSSVTGGTVTLDVNAGGAVTKENAQQPIRPGGGAAPATGSAPAAGNGAAAGGSVDATVDNNITEAQSSLSDFLGRISADARLVDNGVQAEITIEAGASGIPGFNLEQSSITVTYSEGNVQAEGTIAVSHESGKMSGSVTVTWDGTSWALTGTAEVQDLVDGLDPFSVTIEHRGEETMIRCEEVSYSREFGAISLTGTGRELEYDVNSGGFSGALELEADLGAFGTATANAQISDNALDSASFTYDSPELKYPANSDSPVFTGTVGGDINFENGQFSGAIRGTANIALPGLLSAAENADPNALGLDVNVNINADGNYSGTIATTQPIQLGDYFEIQSLSAELAEDGAISSEFTVSIVNISYLNEGTITCAIDENGFRVVSAQAEVPFGSEGDRVWGTIGAGYSEEEGFQVNGNANLTIKEGMVAHGDFSYSTKTNELNAELGVDEIKVLEYGPQEHELLNFDQDVIIFTLYNIIGLYLDVGISLNFNYSLELNLTPTVTLEGLSLDTFEFDQAEAQIELGGALVAALIGTPNIGLGLFAGHPKLLKGGGGLEVPVKAEAKVTPSGTVGVSYDSEGNISGDAKVGMAMEFGIDGSVNPYAEFSVLDGAFERTWQGDSLADFEILPPRELFNYELDLGGDLTKEENPEIPTAPQEPTAPQGGTVLEQDANPQTRNTPAPRGQAEQAAESSMSGEPAGETAEGFDFGGLIDQLLSQPGLSTIKDVLDAAAETWDAIQGFVGSIVKFFDNWFSSISTAIQDILRGFAEHGLVGYLKVVLREKVGDEVYNIIEPVLDALGNIEDDIVELLEQPMPSTAGEFFEWGLQLVQTTLGIGFGSIRAMARAVGTMSGRLASAAPGLLNYVIEQGDLGVQRYGYWYWNPVNNFFGKTYFLAATEYKINLLGTNIYFKDEGNITSPGSAVAVGLWNALEGISGVNPTNTRAYHRTGEAYNDYWRD